MQKGNIYSELYVVPKSNDMNKVWLWSEGYFSGKGL